MSNTFVRVYFVCQRAALRICAVAKLYEIILSRTELIYSLHQFFAEKDSCKIEICKAHKKFF